jgi:hypothetical protein
MRISSRNADELVNDTCILADHSAKNSISRAFTNTGNKAALRGRILIHFCTLDFQFQWMECTCETCYKSDLLHTTPHQYFVIHIHFLLMLYIWVKNYIPALNHGSTVTFLTSTCGLLTSFVLHKSLNHFWLGF